MGGRTKYYTLHTETVQSWLPLTRLHILLHFLCLFFLFYYRFYTYFSHQSHIPKAPWILMTLAEFLFSVMWILNQSFRWRPVSRTVKTDKLPKELPGLDIFICTIDPEKEPTVGVMDTVVSAIAMDYPVNKLAVYLSDDGAAPVTLYGIRKASEFAKEWVPFCKKYEIKTTCPKVFFSEMGDDQEKEQEHRLVRTTEFEAEKVEIKERKKKEVTRRKQRFLLSETI